MPDGHGQDIAAADEREVQDPWAIRVDHLGAVVKATDRAVHDGDVVMALAEHADVGDVFGAVVRAVAIDHVAV